MVGLLKRYSKPEYQGPWLRRMTDLSEKSVNMQAREADPLPRIHRLAHRLSDETIAELVQAYQAGASTPELERRYELGHASVIKILHGHSVEMRGQGLADADVATAAELYRGGATLAQLGERFGISPNAVRRALIVAGVVMRARSGSKPRTGH